ncbi:hypothetical protein [Lysinibacillus sp. TE18511]
MTKEKKKTELEQEEFGMEFSPEELEVTEEKEQKEQQEQKIEQINNKEKSKKK